MLFRSSNNSRIRRILRNGNVAGAVQTLAGNGTQSPNVDGTGAAATIPGPSALFLRGNTLTVRDFGGLMRQIDLTSAAVTTLTGSRTFGRGEADGPASVARISTEGGVTGAPSGGFMLADSNLLRSVSAAGEVRTIASNRAVGVTSTGTGVLAQMPMTPSGYAGVTVDAAGNVIVADPTARTLRRISPAGVVTLVSGLVQSIHAPLDGVGSVAQLAAPRSVISGAAGALWFIDGYGVRKVEAPARRPYSPARQPISVRSTVTPRPRASTRCSASRAIARVTSSSPPTRR